MQPFNFNDSAKQAEEKYGYGGEGGSSDYYKITEGANKLRILAGGDVIGEHFVGKGTPSRVCYGTAEGCPFKITDDKGEQVHPKPSVKWVFWVVDRKDGKVKLASFGSKIFNGIKAVQESEDYHFDSLPMQFDITIKAENAGTKDVDYQVLPSPRFSPPTQAELDELAKKGTVAEYIANRKAKQMKGDGVAPSAPKAQEKVEYPEGPEGEIPF